MRRRRRRMHKEATRVIRPSLEELMDHSDSRYTLVVMAARRARKIMSAQKARGADFDSGSVFHRAKALVPLLVPLFISAFRRADELATAMECRCYHGGEGRTKLHVLRFGGADWAALAVMLALMMLTIFLGRMSL